MRIYEELWREAVPALEAGRPRLDPHLLDKARDRRRGVSLIVPLSEAVRERIQEFLAGLASRFPGQYFYQPAELHVTVVTLIPATEQWREEMGDVKVFRELVGEALGHHGPFDLEFRGVTAATNAVLVRGFTNAATLENIRAELRRVFVEHGFVNRLDRRYPNAAAHVTGMRFCRPDADWRGLLKEVAANRQTDLGRMRVNTLQLTWGDWYASVGTLRVLEEYGLKGEG